MASNIEFGFVILHYLTYKTTISCVNNLLNFFSNYNIKIVIIDNGSTNKSGTKIKNTYLNNKYVDVILNSCNEGFARGNNKGYHHLIKKYNPNFIIVMNNDVLITQTDFLDCIYRIYDRTGFSVLGPDIYFPSNKTHENPIKTNCLYKEKIYASYLYFCKCCKHPFFHYCRININNKIIHKSINNNTNYQTELNDVALHGSCYIFSKNYINKRKYCFNPKTFLYREEEILYFECMNSGLKLIYSPEIKVTHLEDVSTKAAIKTSYNRFKVKNLQLKESTKILYELIAKETI